MCRILPLLAILLSFGLGLQLLDRFPLREDEALYSYWALHLRHEDPWMLTVWPDKPPLYLWGQAALFSLLGEMQATARLLNIGLTTATVALLVPTSRCLGHDKSTVAALLFALNPFALSFAATAYTDPLLVFCGQLALYLALRGQMVGAGIALGAAIMTKQQGLLYLPLLLALAMVDTTLRPSMTTRIKLSRLLALLGGLLLLVGPLLYGDSLRWTVAPSPWDLSVRNYGGMTLVAPAQWWARAHDWLALLWYVGGSWWAWCVYGILALPALDHMRPWHRGRRSRAAALLLLLWLLGFLAFHLVMRIQIWDRYLLPLIPIAMLLISGAVAQFMVVGARYIVPLRPKVRALVPICCLLLLLPTALRAAQGGLPLGGDHGAYNGLPSALAWLRAEQQVTPTQPLILYQQRLGWQLHFYLYSEQRERQVEVRWFANAVTLAADAAKGMIQRRFILQPTWAPIADLTLHMATRNLEITKERRFGNMILFDVQPRPQHPCAWCVCRATEPEAAAKWVNTSAKPWATVSAAAVRAGPTMICQEGE